MTNKLNNSYQCTNAHNAQIGIPEFGKLEPHPDLMTLKNALAKNLIPKRIEVKIKEIEYTKNTIIVGLLERYQVYLNQYGSVFIRQYSTLNFHYLIMNVEFLVERAIDIALHNNIHINKEFAIDLVNYFIATYSILVSNNHLYIRYGLTKDGVDLFQVDNYFVGDTNGTLMHDPNALSGGNLISTSFRKNQGNNRIIRGVLDENNSTVRYIFELFSEIGVEKEYQHLLMTWMICSTIPIFPYQLLELTSDNHGALFVLQSWIKGIMDAQNKLVCPLPKTTKELHDLTVSHHLLNFSCIRSLSASLQHDMLSLLDGVRVEYFAQQSRPTIFDAKRPIMIGSSESLIDLPELIDRTISISLEHINYIGFRPKEARLLPDKFLQMREAVITKFNQEGIIFPYDPFDAFIATGVVLMKIAKNESVNEWVDTINKVLMERQLSALKSNPIAESLYHWAQNNPSVTLTKTVNDWMNDLKEYNSGVDELYPTTARKTGDMMSKSIPLLEPFGIRILVHDKTGGTYQREVSSPEALKIVQLTLEDVQRVANRFFFITP